MHWLKRTIRIIVLLLSTISGSIGALAASKDGAQFVGELLEKLYFPEFLIGFLAFPLAIIIGAAIGFWAVWFFYWFATHLFIEVPDESSKTKNTCP